MMPRYPIFIPSKGRFENCYTAKCLQAEGVRFKLVVEPQEAEEYAQRFGERNILEHLSPGPLRRLVHSSAECLPDQEEDHDDSQGREYTTLSGRRSAQNGQELGKTLAWCGRDTEKIQKATARGESQLAEV